MSIYSKDKTIMKTIRISPSENDNWDINKIHDLLSGTVSSNDSIRINALKGYLKVLYDIMEKNFELKKDFIPEEKETLLKIEEIVGR